MRDGFWMFLPVFGSSGKSGKVLGDLMPQFARPEFSVDMTGLAVKRVVWWLKDLRIERVWAWSSIDG